MMSEVNVERGAADSLVSSSTTSAGADRPSRWLKHLEPPGDDDRGAVEVVCFPHSGGGAGAFRPLSVELRGRARVVAIQYPGRLDRLDDPVITDLHQLADRIAETLRAAPTDRERIFFGHSMGAIVAYEVTQRLGAEGPRGLVVSARPAPSRVRLTTCYQLDDNALLGEVLRLGGTRTDVFKDPEMRSLLLPLIRGDYRASETYRPRGDDPVACTLVAMTGDADPVASIDDVQAWSGHTTGRFRLEVLSGGHFFLQEHWPTVAAIVLSSVSR